MKIVSYLFGVVIVLSGLLISSAQAMTPIGPSVATLDDLQFAVGFGYSHSKGDIEISALGLKATAKDVEIDTYMANLALGISKDWEVQFDIGGSSFDYVDFSSTGDCAWGFGVKNTLWEKDKIKLGAAFTLHWYEASDSGVTLGIPWEEKVRWREIQIAVGPSYKDDAVCLYGGPFLHFIDGDGDVTIGGIEFSGDIEQDSIFGGFIGGRLDLNDNISLGVEYQLTSSVQAIGASILWRF
ncbi:hypothetical protein ES702_06450 [subsurface metagenome]